MWKITLTCIHSSILNMFKICLRVYVSQGVVPWDDNLGTIVVWHDYVIHPILLYHKEIMILLGFFLITLISLLGHTNCHVSIPITCLFLALVSKKYSTAFILLYVMLCGKHTRSSFSLPPMASRRRQGMYIPVFISHATLPVQYAVEIWKRRRTGSRCIGEIKLQLLLYFWHVIYEINNLVFAT